MLACQDRTALAGDRVEAGEVVDIARNGVPVARLVRLNADDRPGVRFLAAFGKLAGQIHLAEDFELGDDELDGLFGGSV